LFSFCLRAANISSISSSADFLGGEGGGGGAPLLLLLLLAAPVDLQTMYKQGCTTGSAHNWSCMKSATRLLQNNIQTARKILHHANRLCILC
jgi:hypothetical protein